MTDAEQGEEREEERRDSGCQEERDRKARGGIRAAGPGRRKKREAKSDRQTRLACWRSGRRDTGKEEEEGVDEGEFECVRKTWTEATVSSWS